MKMISVLMKPASGMCNMYRDYKKRGWNYQQYIACLEPLGEGHGTVEYAIRPREYGQFLIRLFELWYRDWLVGKQPYNR